MSEGYSLTAFAGQIGVSRATLNLWMAANPEFMEAVSRGKAARLLQWEKIGMSVAKEGGGPGSSTMIVFGLKNMGGDEWSAPDRVESKVDMSAKVEVSPDAAFAELVGTLEGVARAATANHAPEGTVAEAGAPGTDPAAGK